MKLCMECKHGYAAGGFWNRWTARCQHPDAMLIKVIDLVTGQHLPALPRLCVQMRGESELCGIEGKLWERA